MKHRTLDEIVEVAQIAPVEQKSDARSIRRQRLERLATLLEEHKGRIRLFSLMEYAPAKKLKAMRQADSPLTIAYRDPLFRQQGLDSDCVGDAMVFFDISAREAHHLLCDCHYAGSRSAAAVANRARSLAERKTLVEKWQTFRRHLWSLGSR
jgi:predicted protein tyrosine phosphatase